MTQHPKIAIIGYGSMGREIEKLALSEGISITNIFDIDTPLEKKTYDFEVGIDFSLPNTVQDNIKLLSEMKKSVVLGTTGWQKDFEKIRDIVIGSGIGLVYSSNFSIGMQMFSRIVQNAARLINTVDGYDVMLHEIHHRRKADSPSGTALSLAKMILDEVEKKNEILTETSHETISASKLHITSTRVGEITGTHTVYLDSAADTIELIHRAKNRSGFAMGAMLAAKWLHGKTGFYDFRDILSQIWE